MKSHIKFENDKLKKFNKETKYSTHHKSLPSKKTLVHYIIRIHLTSNAIIFTLKPIKISKNKPQKTI